MRYTDAISIAIGITKKFGLTTAVSEVNFEVSAGEMFYILFSFVFMILFLNLSATK
ncbi:MAG: hypothetical protein ACD_24C00478G0003, partial [uncultured bacterium]